MPAYLRAGSLTNFAVVAKEMGLNPQRALRESGLDVRALTEPDLRIPAPAVVKLLDTSARRSGCATFGLRMAETRQISSFGALSLLITHQATLRDVMATVSQYPFLLNEALLMHVEQSGDLVVLREELAIESQHSMVQAYELAVGTLFRLIRALLGNRWHAQSIHFVHPAPDDLTVHRRLFGFNIRFDSEFNGIVCRATDLDRANPSADPVMAQYAKQFLEHLPRKEPGSITPEVRKAVYLLLPMGEASITRVAESLGMNVRTMQRWLDEEGEDYAGLVDGVRRELAVRYLRGARHSVSDVAHMLGYAQLSSFTRWFTAQFGASPLAWRAKEEHSRPATRNRLARATRR